jgi:hypothetical protein
MPRKTSKKVTPTKATVEQAEQEPQTEVKTLEQRQAQQPDRWAKVLRIVDASPTGKPYRVVIACQDVQDEEICEGEREIATQDLFQVDRCVPCQRRAVNRRRAANRKAKAEAAPKAKANAKAAPKPKANAKAKAKA